jgi:hypothetical protein
MKRLRLVRVSEHSGATMGVLCIDDMPEFVTLEEAWRDNERNISCIPVGRYKLRPKVSPSRGRVWQVMNVPERDHILIHAGNTHKDTQGCILVGMQFGVLESEAAILASKSAFQRFMTLMAGTPEAELVIIDAYGGGRVH